MYRILSGVVEVFQEDESTAGFLAPSIDGACPAVGLFMQSGVEQPVPFPLDSNRDLLEGMLHCF